MKIQIWNPTKNEDYVLQDHVTKRTFSSYSSNAFMTEVVGNLPWSAKCAELERFFTKTTNGEKGFFSVSPWSPGAKALREEIKGCFGEAFENDADIYGYFETDQLRVLMEIRDAAGGFDSGEWRIGSCFSDFDDFENTDIRKDISFFLDNVENVGVLLDLSEMQQALLLVKSYDGTRADIERLLAT